MNPRRCIALLLGASFGARILDAQRPVEDPLTIFAKMMPVLSHDRCVNCHGATDAFKGFYHPGAVSRSTPCFSCHTANARWDVAPPPMRFFQRSTRQLCEHFSVNLPVGDASALHLENDDLIGLAFAGRRGNAVPPQYTEKPPMTRAQFVRAYRNWVEQTGGICSAWEGTITRTETVASDTTGPGLRDARQFGPMAVTSWQRGTHTITVKIKDGTAVVTASLDGERNTRQVTEAGACRLTALMRDAYSLESTKPSTGASASAAGGATTPLVAVGNGSVRVGVAADGSYRIHVVPPAEKTRTTSTTTISTTCPMAKPSTPESSETFDWSPWTFEIAATLSDPRVRTRLEGVKVDTLDHQPDPPFGLAAMGAAVGRLDDTRVRFIVRTEWKLQRAY